jgi:serine/threonine protein kinase
VPGQDSIQLLPHWERAAQLAHPGLTRIFDGGTCRLDDLEVEYVVMEYAEENLADVLSQRPLEAGEAREMLEPLLDTLAGVHAHGYVLGHLKPSNILSVGDQVKLAGDGLRPVGHANPAPAGPYDAPERAPLSPAADVWSLGITVVEALTQHPPQRPWLKFLKPALPPKMPGFFVDIARDCLQPNPARRESVVGLASRLRQPLTPLDAPAYLPELAGEDDDASEPAQADSGPPEMASALLGTDDARR